MSKQENATIRALEKSNVSRYIQLASLFRNRIETGEWRVGERIPTVKELADQCGVATMTIRQSLDMLETEGLIERFRAKGTFVKERPNRDLWCEVRTDWTGLLLARQDAEIEILEDERNVALPPFEGNVGNPGQGYRRMRRRHLKDDVTFLIADVFINEEVCKLIPEENIAKVTALRLVSDLPGHEIADANQIVTVGSADLETSLELNISIGDPVAKVQRKAVNQHGDILLLTVGIYRGDTMKIEIKLR